MSGERTSDGVGRTVVLAVAVLLAVPLLLMALAMPLMGLMGWMWGGGTVFAPVWGVVMMLLWIVVLVGGGLLVYRAATRGSTPGGGDPALEELRVAYARGDLTDEEFERRRERLRRGE